MVKLEWEQEIKSNLQVGMQSLRGVEMEVGRAAEYEAVVKVHEKV